MYLFPSDVVKTFPTERLYSFNVYSIKITSRHISQSHNIVNKYISDREPETDVWFLQRDQI